jgi:predicted nucleic acid-binding protein
MAFVVDASIVGCWCFPDEADALADLAFQRVHAEGAIVPALWWFEVRNLVVMAERRGRLEPTGAAEFLADLEDLPVRIDREPHGETILALARAHRLTVYDAAYLELARRLDAPLATLDRALAAAARAASVPLLGDEDA